MIDHLHKLGQHSNWAFPIEQGKGGRESLFGGEGGVAKSKITGYSLYIFFSLRRAVDGILIFSRILTIDRCYYFFLVSLCYDLDLIALLALLIFFVFLLFCCTAISKGGILNSIPLKAYPLCTTRLNKRAVIIDAGVRNGLQAGFSGWCVYVCVCVGGWGCLLTCSSLCFLF